MWPEKVPPHTPPSLGLVVAMSLFVVGRRGGGWKGLGRGKGKGKGELRKRKLKGGEG